MNKEGFLQILIVGTQSVPTIHLFILEVTYKLYNLKQITYLSGSWFSYL